MKKKRASEGNLSEKAKDGKDGKKPKRSSMRRSFGYSEVYVEEFAEMVNFISTRILHQTLKQH